MFREKVKLAKCFPESEEFVGIGGKCIIASEGMDASVLTTTNPIIGLSTCISYTLYSLPPSSRPHRLGHHFANSGHINVESSTCKGIAFYSI